MTKRLRILHIITRSDWGGAPRIVQLLASGSSGQSAVACGPGGELISRLQDTGVPVHVQPHLKSPPDPVADCRAFVGLVSLLRRSHFDLVHCHSTKAGALGRLAASVIGIPRVFTVHGWGFYNAEYNWLEPILRRGERHLSRVSDSVVCVSKNDLRIGREYEILQPDSGRVIHNGVPPLTVNEDRRTAVDEFGLDPATTVVGAVARLSEQKNPLAIVRAVGRLQERGHDVTLLLIGSGPLEEKCRQHARNQGIKAVIPGFREDGLKLMADIDIFLLPSRFEGLPLTVLEAMHLGVPIVAYDVGGVAEAVVDGKTGFVVSQGEFGTFVSQAEQMLTTGPETFSQASKERARAYFTADRMVSEYDELYQRIVST